MDIRITTVDGRDIVEGAPGKQLLQSPDDVADVIVSCFEHGTQAVLLHAENLTEGFFDLSSGEAGAILQKLRNYRMRLAVVAPTDDVHQSSRFGEMVQEESKGGDFRLFEDRESAVAWLLGR
jgi:hypothetical protein